MSEETNVRISVIVPIYNAEKWLEECIESICRQTYSCLEILLIDDGSTDKSLLICKNKAMIDSRIRVISKENSGVSETRNLGMHLATGKYLTFLDADDYLHPEALENAMKYMKDDVQLCVWNVSCVKNTSIVQEPNIPEGRISRRDALISVIYDRCADVQLGRYFRASWGKLYCTDIIKSYDIQFPPLQRIGEDALFLLEYIRHIDCIVGINYAGYYYRITNTSAVRRYRKDLLEQNQYQMDAILEQLEHIPEYKGIQLDTAVTCLAWDMFRKLIRNNLISNQSPSIVPQGGKNDAQVWIERNWHILRKQKISKFRMPKTTRLQFFLSGYLPLKMLCKISEWLERTKL